MYQKSQPLIHNLDVHTFLAYLKGGIKFSLARFNDGEMLAIAMAGKTTARGTQECTVELSEALKSALSFKGKNYYVGLPCSLCYPALRRLADELSGERQANTSATVLTNNNLSFFVKNLSDYLGDRRVVWLSSEDQQVERLSYLGITVNKHLTVPCTNAFEHFSEVKEYSGFLPRDIVFLSCGPLAEPLIHYWHDRFNEVTFIDVGSVFDNLTRGVWHRCHEGTLPECPECNPLRGFNNDT